jgi:hypothetical protein
MIVVFGKFANAAEEIGALSWCFSLTKFYQTPQLFYWCSNVKATIKNA